MILTNKTIVANMLGSFLVPLDYMDPIREVWLPVVVSDPLLFATSLFCVSVVRQLLVQ